jgi:hypothetical protein
MDGWIVPTATERDADGRGKASSSSSSRTRVSFIAEKRVEHPNPKRIIIVNESNRTEPNRVRAQQFLDRA